MSEVLMDALDELKPRCKCDRCSCLRPIIDYGWVVCADCNLGRHWGVIIGPSSTKVKKGGGR